MTWLSRIVTAIAENRQSEVGAIDPLIESWDRYYADGDSVAPTQTAAVAFGIGLIYRAMILSEITPEAPITPLDVALIGAQLMLSGNYVASIDVSARGLRLLPVSDYDIAGQGGPESWVYEIRQPTPSDTERTRYIPGAGIVHVRYQPRAAAPWRGISPLQAAGLAPRTLARIERSLMQDAGIPTGAIQPVPDGASDKSLKQIKAAISAGKGALSVIETTRAGFGQGTQAAPQRDWETKRFGPQTPATSIELREKSALWVLAAMGIPPSLFTSEGGAQRESWRHFMSGTVAPLGNLIMIELSEKLEQDMEIYFSERARSDISALSRAYRSLTDAGVAPDRAAEIVGIRI